MHSNTNRRAGLTLLEITSTVAVIVLLAAIAVPSIKKARGQEQHDAIVRNLRAIEFAKEQWALAHKKIGGEPSAADLAPYMKNRKFPPAFVIGETYNINPLGAPASATLPKEGYLFSPQPGGIVTLP